MSESLWETIAWNAFHDIICGSVENDSLKEALRKYRLAEDRAARAIEARMVNVAASMPAQDAGNGKVLFNSLPYSRKEIVPVEKGFVETEIPACGFALVPRENKRGNRKTAGSVKIARNGRGLENALVMIVFGLNGTIASLYDKESGCELALPDNGMNNPLRQPDYGDLWTTGSGPINSSLLRTAPSYDPQPGSGTAVVREGRLDARAADADCYAWPQPAIIYDHALQCSVEFRYPQLGYITRVTLRKGEKLVRFRSVFIPNGKKYRLRVAFPTTINKGRIRHSVPFGHIERPEGEYATQGWIDYADVKKGLLLLNKGLPGNNVTGNVMMLSLFRAVAMEDEEAKSWYEEGIEHIFEYALMPFDPKDRNYNPAREAALFNRELCCAAVSGIDLKAGIPNSRPFIELEGGNAELSCLQREKCGVTLRVWESRGRKGVATCVLAHEIASCVRTDATGENQRKQQFSNHSIPINLNPFEIVTMKVAFK